MVITLLCYRRHSRSKGSKGKESLYAGIWWFGIFTLGLVLLGVHYFNNLETHGFGDVASVIVASFSYAIRMFTFNFSQGEIIGSILGGGNPHDYFHAIALIICFACAGIWTYLMLVKIFFQGIGNSFRIFFHKHALRLFRKKTKHYIVIGCGTRAEVFIENLSVPALKKEKGFALIKTRLFRNDITIITGEQVGTGKKAEDCYNKFLDKGYAVICGKADEASLKLAGYDKNNRKKIIVVAITDSDEQNIAVADTITRKIFSFIFPHEKYNDFDFRKKVSMALLDSNSNESRLREKVVAALEKISLEAHIMYTFIERIENFSFAENAYGRVDFFNPYELCMRKFFWDHPITNSIHNMIDFSKARLTGTLGADGQILKFNTQSRYKIKNIFIGFGLTNFQMLKGSIMTNQLYGCDYNAIIFDENIPQNYDLEKESATYQSVFINQAPGFFGYDEKMHGLNYFESPKEQCHIVFKHGNAFNREFYESTLEEIKDNDLTIIYIALGEDKLSIETACKLRQTLCESFFPLPTIRIYVKVREKSAILEDTVINSIKVPLRIEFFGLDRDVLTEEEIARETIDDLAQALSNKAHDTPWEYLSEFERASNRHKVLDIRVMLGFLGFDIAQTAHNDVIEQQYKEMYGLDDLKIATIIGTDAKENKSIRLKYLKTDNGEISGPISDTARNNLARREHLRWNTFHLANGWTKKPMQLTGGKNGSDDLNAYFDLPLDSPEFGRKNQLARQHACITTYEGLIELRRWQAEKADQIDCEENFDVIYHDFTLLDNLIDRLHTAKTDWAIVRLPMHMENLKGGA